MCSLFREWVNKVGKHSPYAVPLVYHIILSLQTKSGQVKKKPDKEQSEDDKEINFVLLEERDFVSNRVLLSVEAEPVKSGPSLSSAKSPPTANSSDSKKITKLSDMSVFKESLLHEPMCPLG